MLGRSWSAKLIVGVAMQISQLLEGINIIGISGRAEGEVSSICYSADKCEKGSLFVAISGLRHDGHDFIPEAVARGAEYIVHEREFKYSSPVAAIKVSSSRSALGILACNFFRHPSSQLCLIGVTGTSGKTTVTYFLESILKSAGFSCGVLGTVNYRYQNKIFPAPNTTPESYEMQKILREMADEGITHVITEVSSHALDLRRVDDCDFDIGIFTNLTPEHLDYHPDMEAYFQAKKRLFSEILPQSKKIRSRRMVINNDDSWGKRILREVKLPALSYGLGGDCSVAALDHGASLDGIHTRIRIGERIIEVSSGLIGRFNLYNMLAAAGAASLLGISPDMVKGGIENLSSVPGRLEKVDSPANFHVFVDYAHKPDALNQVLQNLTELKKKRIITVFGCGGNRDRSKRPLMGRTAVHYSDFTIVTSDNPRLEDPAAIIREIEAGIDSGEVEKLEADQLEILNGVHSYTVIPDRKKAIETAIHLAREADIVLIAGKGHEDYQILGTKKIPFDDRLIAADALKTRSK